MPDVTIERGFPEEQRDRAAALFWQAFSGKLGRIMAPEETALAFLGRALQPAYAFSACDPSGRLVGLAGVKTQTGGLVGGTPRDMAQFYGWPGALWRGPLLDLTERKLKPGQMLLDGLCVAEGSRCQGVGTALIETIVAEARLLGFSEVRLDVIDSNPRARALYERNGFVATGETGLGPFSLFFGFNRATTMCLRLDGGVGGSVEHS